MKCCDHTVLALDGVRGGKQLPGWFTPQHEAAAIGGREPIGGVGLTALELLDVRQT
jgi:hypothetical protein